MRDLSTMNSDRGRGGGKNPENLTDVICTWPLTKFVHQQLLQNFGTTDELISTPIQLVQCKNSNNFPRPPPEFFLAPLLSLSRLVELPLKGAPMRNRSSGGKGKRTIEGEREGEKGECQRGRESRDRVRDRQRCRWCGRPPR